MAQIDPKLLEGLLKEEDATTDKQLQQLVRGMTDEECIAEAEKRSEMDSMLQSLYCECYTDRHLDLAGMLMEQYNECRQHPENAELQFTREATMLVPWAKAMVAMQLVQLAGQSTTDEKDRAHIGEIKYKGIELIALNYKRCSEQITNMLTALADAGVFGDGGGGDGGGGAAAGGGNAVGGSRSGSPHSQPSVSQDQLAQMQAEVRQNEARMAEILKLLEAGGQGDDAALALATEYTTLKAATNAVVNDIRLKDPQQLIHAEWMHASFTPERRALATRLLAANPAPYPELRPWAAAMDALDAFTQEATVGALNTLLLALANTYREHRGALSPKLRKNKSRIGSLRSEGISLNRSACFIRAHTALDDEDWNAACLAFTPDAAAVLEAVMDGGDAAEAALAEYASNVPLLVEYAQQAERSIAAVVEEGERHEALLSSLLQPAHARLCALLERHPRHRGVAARVAEAGDPAALLRWAAAVLALTEPAPSPALLAALRTVSTFARENPGELAAQEADPSADFAEGLKCVRAACARGGEEGGVEWGAVEKTAGVLVSEGLPTEMVEWAFAATETKEALGQAQEWMDAALEGFDHHAAAIEALAAEMDAASSASAATQQQQPPVSSTPATVSTTTEQKTLSLFQSAPPGATEAAAEEEEVAVEVPPTPEEVVHPPPPAQTLSPPAEAAAAPSAPAANDDDDAADAAAAVEEEERAAEAVPAPPAAAPEVVASAAVDGPPTTTEEEEVVAPQAGAGAQQQAPPHDDDSPGPDEDAPPGEQDPQDAVDVAAADEEAAAVAAAAAAAAAASAASAAAAAEEAEKKEEAPPAPVPAPVAKVPTPPPPPPAEAGESGGVPSPKARRRKSSGFKRPSLASVGAEGDVEGGGTPSPGAKKEKKEKKKKRRKSEGGGGDDSAGEDGGGAAGGEAKKKRKKKKKKGEEEGGGAGGGDGEEEAEGGEEEEGLVERARSEAATEMNKTKSTNASASEPAPLPQSLAQQARGKEEEREEKEEKKVEAVVEGPKPVIQRDNGPRPSSATQVIQVQHKSEDASPSPSDAGRYVAGDAIEMDPTKIFVKPAPRTLAARIKANPSVARGIIFVQPHREGDE